ncbi:MAG TPA: hypothetical protein VJ927_05410 [Actinomycetota bacterium]|nr:hypothetical protein [Actinomycetota bacterium]
MANGGIPPEWSARFPEVARDKDHYESFYLKASHPDEPRAVWIRYTVHKAPGRDATGSTWFTYFDRDSAPVARKATVPGPRAGQGNYIEIDGSSFGPGRAQGSAEDASWDLETVALTEPLMHLPKPWMYRAPIPRTKSISPAPEASFSGILKLGDRSVEVDGWRGMWGHNWGAEHAERWIWLHGLFAPGTWLDVVMGRIRIGGWTTPWIANGALSLDGRRHRVGGIGKVRATEVDEQVGSCGFTLPGEIPVRGTVGRSLDQTVVWAYADPSGGEHHSLNSSLASMHLDCNGRTLLTQHGAVYELGIRETDHGLPVLPYPDG